MGRQTNAPAAGEDGNGRGQLNGSPHHPDPGQLLQVLAGRGWKLFGLPRGSKVPRVRWRDAATCDPDRVALLDGGNVGLATGPESGTWALDIDGEAGEASLRELIEQHGALPDTLESRTARGRHLFFTHSPDLDLRNRAGFRPGLDARGDGGYVLIPPSVHPTGACYEWARDPLSAPVADAPAWLVDLVTSRPRMEPSRNGTAPSMTVEQALHENLTDLDRERLADDQADDLPKLLDALGRSTPPPDREHWIRILLAATAVARTRRWPQGEVDAALRAWNARGANYEEREDGRQLAACWSRVLDGREASFGTLTELLGIDPRRRPASVEAHDDDLPEFPEHVLPPILAEHARAVAASRRADPTLCFLANLAAASMAVGRAVEGVLGVDPDKVRLLDYRDGDSFAPNFSALLVAASGTGKSSAISSATARLREADRDLRRVAAAQRAEYTAEVEAYRSGLKAAKRNGTVRPEPPLLPRRLALVAERMTAEAAAEMVQDNPRGVGVAVEEFGNLLRGIGPEAQQALLAVAKAGLSGGAFRRDIKGTGRTDEEASSGFDCGNLVVLAGVHEEVLRRKLLGDDKDPELRTGGLLQRLFVYPSHYVPERGLRKVPVSNLLRARWGGVLGELLELQQCPTMRGAQDRWTPRLVGFTDRANEMLSAWDLRADSEACASLLDEPAAGFIRRSHLRAAQAALLLALLYRECPRPDLPEPAHRLILDKPGQAAAVPAWAVELGIELVEWQDAVARSYLGGPQIALGERKASVLAWIQQALQVASRPFLTAAAVEKGCRQAQRAGGEERFAVLRRLRQDGQLDLVEHGQTLRVYLKGAGR